MRIMALSIQVDRGLQRVTYAVSLRDTAALLGFEWESMGGCTKSLLVPESEVSGLRCKIGRFCSPLTYFECFRMS